MDPLLIDFIAGLATAVMLVLGYALGIKTLLIWRDKKKGLILFTAILFFALPSPWIEFAVRMILGFFDYTLNDNVGLYLFAWAIPALAISWVYITAFLFNRPWVRYLSLAATVIPTIIFFFSVYINKEYHTEPIGESIARNYVFDPLPQALIYYFGALGLLFVFPSYLYFSQKTSNPLVKFKTRMVYISSLLFSITAVIDGTTTFGNMVVLLTLRVMIMISFIFLYLGYNTPTRYKEKYSS